MIVLIADDHASITYVATHLVEQTLGDGAAHEVHVVSNVAALLSQLERVGPQDCLLILDLTMPGEFKRLALIREVLRCAPRACIIVYSASDEPLLVEAAFELGIAAYVSKAASVPCLKAAIKAAATGQAYMDPSIRLREAIHHPWKALTPTEREVIVALAKGQDVRSLANDTGRAYQTVANHKYAALQKLGLSANGQISGFMLQHGLSFLLDS